jgi:hypothetical protein
MSFGVIVNNLRAADIILPLRVEYIVSDPLFHLHKKLQVSPNIVFRQFLSE